ncbi:Cytochrome c oxidase Cu(A) center assembly protein [Bacillus cereus AH676]|nr:Cytochrome c oxidase Cu(A) center assembly protein [Bacillus cereus AH676]
MKRYQKIIGLMVVFCLFVLAGCSESGSKLRKPLNWGFRNLPIYQSRWKEIWYKD